jgi:hypothetical protein
VAANFSEEAKCSFCGKPPKQVRKLIAGSGVWICDECVDLCVVLNAEESQGRPSDEAGSESDGSWRIEIQVQTDDLAVRDRLLNDIASWRRIADGLSYREVDLVSGGARVQSYGRGKASGETPEVAEDP